MKVLVTGGCGYIGSHTVLDLLDKQYDVVCVDNLQNASVQVLEDIKDITGKLIPNYKIDVADLTKMRSVFQEHQDIQAVIHFAARKYVYESVEKPLMYYNDNIQGLLTLLKCVEEFKIPHIVFSSSCSVYGLTEDLPVTEQTSYSQAASPYALTKQIGESILRDYARHKPLAVSILRYFNPGGAHPSGLIGENTPIAQSLISLTVKAARNKTPIYVMGTDYPTRDGTCIRDYIHVCDIANAHTLTLQHMHKSINPLVDKERYLVFNLGSGKGTTVKEVLAAFEEVTGVMVDKRETSRRKGDIVSIYANFDKAQSILNWTPTYTIKDIMQTAWLFDTKKHIK